MREKEKKELTGREERRGEQLLPWFLFFLLFLLLPRLIFSTILSLPHTRLAPSASCDLQCSSNQAGGGEALGKLYAVISRRRGVVVAEDVVEGTQTYVVHAKLPVGG